MNSHFNLYQRDVLRRRIRGVYMWFWRNTSLMAIYGVLTWLLYVQVRALYHYNQLLTWIGN